LLVVGFFLTNDQPTCWIAAAGFEAKPAGGHLAREIPLAGKVDKAEPDVDSRSRGDYRETFEVRLDG
jgi:hypothetical protein